MNINQAKEHIKYSVQAYLAKDEVGEQIIKIHQQRPVFLMGPPGIGKTDIMKQIAEELNLALVSYSMTHHTRQSALGLPFIIDKKYNGKEYKVSEYTMSEILATVYDLIEETGMKEGILFLDEINCVSETLAPSMLQFLQYKTFGKHKVPDGWIVVTAGNPPEYNNSVKEFDLVTWDRLKRIDVDADFTVWKKYALQSSVHPAIISYLDTKVNDFYSIQSTIDGVDFVTARGWCDLSKVLTIHESLKLPIDKTLVSQYIQNNTIATNFSIYYDLFNKYRDDYHIDDIINSTESDEVIKRATNAKFDELLVLVSLLYFKINGYISKLYSNYDFLQLLIEQIKLLRSISVDTILLELKDRLNKDTASGSKSSSYISTLKRVINTLEQVNQKDALNDLRTIYNNVKKEIESDSQVYLNYINNTFKFIEENLSDKNVMSIWITTITSSSKIIQFLAQNKCEYYIKYSKGLLISNNEQLLLNSIEEFEKIK